MDERERGSSWTRDGHSVPDQEEYAAFGVDWFEDSGEQKRYSGGGERYSGPFLLLFHLA
jgi:hypothetical protein